MVSQLPLNFQDPAMEGSSDLAILNPVNEQLCRINELPLEHGHLSWPSIAM